MEIGAVVAERFVIEHLAGAGGMGNVYRARDRASGEFVALKVLRDEARRHGERFVREARMLAGLHHPGVVRYVAHGVTPGGERYLAMEWLEGEDLAERLARAGLTPVESVVLVTSIAHALSAAHDRGIVHRDLKPRNLFLPHGDVARVKILDFGIARWVDLRNALTHSGAALGTPGYMAPEQARGERDVTPAADIFALGCVWYECLAGQHAFAAEDIMGLLARILLQPAPRLRDARPDIPDVMDALVTRMFASDPAERPRDGAALVNALAALSSLVESDARPLVPSSRPSISTDEQRLLCVVAVGTGSAYDRTVDTAVDRPTDGCTLTDIAAVVVAHGGRWHALADGSGIAVLAGVDTAAATDQAVRAARCALALRSVLVDVPMALATGRGRTDARQPVGEVIDRAARLIIAAASQPVRAMTGVQPVLLDELTVGLLDERFDFRVADGRTELMGWREHSASARTLHGRPSPFVGRAREMAALDGVLAECVGDGVARVVLVTAAAGSGKSRLLHEWLAHLRASPDGPEVLFSRGDAIAAGTPFGLVAHALRAACGVQGGEPLAARQQNVATRVGQRLCGDDAARVTLFLAELAGAPFPPEQSVQLGAARKNPRLMGDQMRRAWEDWLGAETAARPVLLVLEDLHWGDHPSVTLVDSALRALRDRPLMVLALARPEVHDLFPDLWQSREVQEIRLGGLTRRAAERLVRGVLGDDVTDPLLSRLVTQSGGNAFYLEELIRAAASGNHDAAPGTVLAMVASRLGAMEPEARQVLRAASVFGRVFWRGGVEALLGIEGPRLLADWHDELVRREVFDPHTTPRGDGAEELVFRHDLVREAAYAMLPDADRAQGHRRAAAWLRAVDKGDDRVLAEHLERGGDAPQAAACYHRAAEQALEGHDLVGALALTDKALGCGAAGEALGSVRALQAHLHNWSGDFAAAATCGVEALRWLPRQSVRWYTAASDYLVACSVLNDYPQLVTLVTELTAPAPGVGPAGRLEVQVKAVAQLATQFFVSGRPDATERLFTWLADIPEEVVNAAPVAMAAVREARAFRAMSDGDAAACWREMEAAARSHVEAGNLRASVGAAMNAAFSCMVLGAWEEAEARLRSGIATAERLNLPVLVSHGRQNLGLALAGTDHLTEARAETERAVAEYRTHANRRMEGITHLYLAKILARMGDDALAETEARLALDQLADNPPCRAHALATLACIHLQVGGRGVSAALEAAQEARNILDGLGGRVDDGEAHIRLAYAKALAAAGQHAEAREALTAARDRLEARAARISDPAWRKSFLERVPEHLETLRLARAADAEGSAP